jgi:hypothetical protein
MYMYLEGHEDVVGDYLLHAECSVAEVLVWGQVRREQEGAIGDPNNVKLKERLEADLSML